jgi:hypothetical protein
MAIKWRLTSPQSPRRSARPRLISGWKMPYRELNLTVGELPPPFDDRRKTCLRRPIDNFAGFAASRIQGHRECL